MKQLAAALMTAVLGVAACADAPDPGDIAAFCSLLESGVGLSAPSGEAEFAQLALVAPPEIRETIESLQNRARDFDELLADDPPDLEALFLAKFDTAAERERNELDQYAGVSCGLEIDRPPATRWNTFVRERHAEAGWRDVVNPQFEVTADGGVSALTLVFEDAPSAMSLVEEVCRAGVDFIAADEDSAAASTAPPPVRVLIGTVVVLETTVTDAGCQLP